MPTASQPVYRLGCPVWACEGWKGSVYTADSTRRDWLRQYSTMFSAVEVNSTFYAIPALETVTRWGESVQPGFQFCLKFPKSITHDRQLIEATTETMAFLQLMQELARHNCLGPAFLQLPPHFSGRQWPELEFYLRSLPREFAYAVEARHGDYFLRGPMEQRFDDLLTELGMDRCHLDSRPLFSARASDESERQAQRRKPRSPYRTTVTGRRPMVRFIGRNNVEAIGPWIQEWASNVAGWIAEGLQPIVFTHAPDDTNAPELAKRFHAALTALVLELPPLRSAVTAGPPVPRQRTLF